MTNPRMVEFEAKKTGRSTCIPEREQRPKARPATGKRYRVVFRRTAFVIDGMYQLPSSNFQTPGLRNNKTRGAAVRLGKHRKTVQGMYQGGTVIPDLFTSLPPFKRDHPQTDTTIAQHETVQLCLPLLVGVEDPSRSIFDFNSHGLPRLERERHVEFLHKSLRKLGASYVAIDASRPWQIYWSLAGLSILGEDVQQYSERLILFPNPTPADPSAAPAFAATKEYVSQSRADFYAHAKSRWWLWRGSRSNVTLRRIICSDTEPRYGWWKGSLGYD